MKATARVITLIAAATLGACGADRAADLRRSAVLSDGRSDGAPGFFFLPPVAPEPGSGGANDAGLSPVVEIAPRDGGAPIARFAGDEVKASGAHYLALWSTRRAPPAAGTIYRIRVLLDGAVLGFADAEVARSGTELRLLASDEVFGLAGERTVPIKFRIGGGPADPEEPCAGVVCPAPGPCQASVACVPAVGACAADPLPQGTACDDGDACTAGDACDGEGGCAPGTNVCG